jgi:hypothetical protein
MSFIDNLKELFWKFPTVQKKEEPKPVLEPVVEAAVEPAPPPPPKKELKKNDPEKPAQAKRVTGDDVTYYVPYDMRAVQVVLYDRVGRFKNEYTLTNYLSIKPGERVRIKIIK